MIDTKRWSKLAFVTLAACTLASCAQPSEGVDANSAEVNVANDRLDPNDVSILFPLERSKLIRLDEPGKGGPLVPPTVFASALAQSQRSPIVAPPSNAKVSLIDPIHKVNLLDMEKWRILGIHFATCFPSRKNCETGLLRFVAQPVVGEEMLTTADAAAHLIYKIPLGEREAVVGELLRLKKDSPMATNAPMGVHPGLRRHDPASLAFAKSVLAFAKTAAGASNLIEIAFMATNEDKDPWIFFAGKVDGSQWTPKSIPNLAPKKRSDANFGGIFFSPIPINNAWPTGPEILKGARGRTLEGLQAIDRAENPDLVTHGDINCATCHMLATTKRTFYKGAGDTELAFKQNSLSGLPASPAFIPSSGYIVRNFGYFGDQVVLSDRFINESVISASEASSLLANPAVP